MGSKNDELSRRLRGLSHAMYAEVQDLLHHPTFLETRWEIHHNVCKSDHLLRSAHYAWMIAVAVRANRRTCARAGLLHDLHSRLGTWSNHGAIAASVASRLGESKDVCEAIV
ncbi:MAG TPA: HD domain-containing protein, partial [Polyangiaceae bacterium]|nr:HD domain-containing protein [Polyangiaceae bacterium]